MELTKDEAERRAWVERFRNRTDIDAFDPWMRGEAPFDACAVRAIDELLERRSDERLERLEYNE
jgi:cytochrome c556